MEFSKKLYTVDSDDTKDTYFIDRSRAAIDEALREAEGKDLEMTRYLLRRSYCFSLPRKGRAYKIWARLVSEKEAELGIGARKHNKRVGRETNLEG
jgi:hypothetical protein